MEPFKINLVGQVLTIQPRLDNACDVFEGGEKLGAVLPVIINNETK